MDNKRIGKFIKELREEKKLSQQQLADKLFVSRSLVTKWESGKISLTSTNLKSLCEFFYITSDEMLSGVRKTVDNVDQIENVKYRLYDQNKLLKKRIKICFFSIISLVFIFFMYFFITFYNSVQIYTVNIDEKSNFLIDNGLFIKTQDKIYLRLEPKQLNNCDKIEYMKLYYELNGQKKEILKLSSFSVVSINDYIQEQEYFEFDKFDSIKNNLYISFIYKDSTEINIKLKIKKDYSNSKIFFLKHNRKMTNNNVYKNNQDNSINEVINKHAEKNFLVSHNKVNYKIYVLDTQIYMTYKLKDTEEKIVYNNFDREYFSKECNDKTIYSYNIGTDECIVGNCKKYSDDYKKFLEVLEKIK